MAWFISDNHFNHDKIIEYCNRPFSNAGEMNKYMIKQWNSVVGENDLVYHLGDFALQSDKEAVANLVNHLNGNIVLILGNHDRHGKQWFLDCGFIGVYNNLILGDYVLSHRPQTLDKLNDKINIHGHIHNYDKGLDKDKYINVSCEVLDYKPVWIDIDRCNQYSNGIKDLFYSKVISSEEALRDVVPIEWSEDVLSGKKKVTIDKCK